jgi:hypothetical protein
MNEQTSVPFIGGTVRPYKVPMTMTFIFTEHTTKVKNR